MAFSVFIPTAGTGSRLGQLTRDINKSLISVGTRPVLSLLIEQFPLDTNFVIALGHQGHLVREFLLLAYPHRRFVFVEVFPFEGAGSSLGYSLWSCRDHLQAPFVFCSCDTLTTSKIPAPEHNWMGVARSQDIAMYRTVTSQNGKVLGIHEKGQASLPAYPYIGLSGIADTQSFWDAMSKATADELMMGESFGLRSLLETGISMYEMDWYDTGNPQALARTRKDLGSAPGPHILEKPDESIWFVNGSVIKYSKDPEFIRKRVVRAGMLKGYCPCISGSTPHMYCYQKVEGDVVSDIITIELMRKLLEHLIEFWRPYDVSSEKQVAFERACFSFYHDKTYERIDKFYQVTGRLDGQENINGRKMPKLRELLDRINWQWLSQGRAVRFHGDCHFENMLFNRKDQRFIFLDWRQEFAGEMEFGDVYYDLAKLFHGLIVSHEAVVQGRFRIVWGKNDIDYDIVRKEVLFSCEKELFSFLEMRGFEIDKVRILTALIFLNIATLHHYPYNEFLYCLGKARLWEYLGNNERSGVA
ncbi:MAG: phosphotransferase [Candidatus Omnitrophica bacterium]|nr:phosphotransferase [Candidatus Omnitrophota bacterium]